MTKKINVFFFILLFCFVFGIGYASADDDVITQTIVNVSSNEKVLTYSWTADSSGATVRATTSVTAIDGFVFMVVTNPGTTAPTDNYDITLTDADGVDVMAGLLADRDTATSEEVLLSGGRFVNGVVTLNITNNLVTSATGTVAVYVSTAPGGAAGGSGNIHGWTGTSWHPVAIDSMTRATKYIDYAHAEIHGGSSFITDTIISGASMGSGATVALCFKTPAGTKRVHMFVEFITLTGGHIDVIESATWDASSGTTTATPIFNRKRESSMTDSGMLENANVDFAATNSLLLTPANVNIGTIIHDYYAFGKKNAFTGQNRDDAEFVLQPETQYCYQFTSDAASNGMQMTLEWYENTDKTP